MKKLWIVLPLVLIILAATACTAAAPSGESSDMPAVAAQRAAAPAAMEEMVVEYDASKTDAGWGTNDMISEAGNNNDYGGHKIIRNASLGIETREFDLHVSHINQKVNEMGGYVSNSYTSGRKPEKYGDSGRYAGITCRIPQDRMDAFLADTRGLATVTYENSSGEDITSSYYDTEFRLDIYESQRDRILKLLEQAQTMEDIIKLETELSRLTYEIESLTTQLKRWDDLIDFATVSIDVTEIPPSYAVSSDDSMGTRISEGLSRTMSGLAVFFEDFFVFLITSFPVLLLLGAIAAIVLFFYRRRRGKMGLDANKPENSKPERKGVFKKNNKYGSSDEEQQS